MSQKLIISAVFPPEPVVSAKLSFDIANTLSENYSITVVCPKPSRPYGFRFNATGLNFNFNYIQVRSFICASSSILGRFRESFSFGIHCYRHIANNHQNIDVIYANTWPLLGQYFAVKAATKYKIPIVLHVQDIYPESISNKLPLAKSFFNSILLPLDKYILKNSNQVIAISQKMKEYLVKTRKLDNKKISVIPNWQDEGCFPQQSKQEIISEKSLFTFMYLGNIGPVAGLDLLLSAFSLADLKQSQLVIAGSGSSKVNLIKQATNLTHSTIEFWDVPEGKVPEIQSKADVLILPVKKGSASTSIPSKLPAYMFSSKPIIASVDMESDTADAVIKSQCGWVIEPGNIEKLADLMKESVSISKETLQQMGENGRKYALENYSKKNNLKKIIELITSTASK